jgi:putative transposase
VLHRRLPRVDISGQAYYLTCCLDCRQTLFRRGELAELLISLYASERDRGAIALHGYVVMPGHYHVLLTLCQCTSISALVRRVHSFFAPPCRRITGLTGRVWQRRFYDHVIRDATDLRTKLAYLHKNPVRAELVDDPLAYPWSSCRFWETGSGRVACDHW